MQKFSNTIFMIYERSVMLSYIFNCGVGGKVAVKLTSVPRPKIFVLCRLAARSYTNMSATRILWDAKIFQYQLHDIRAFCHAFMDFQLWSRGGGEGGC